MILFLSIHRCGADAVSELRESVRDPESVLLPGNVSFNVRAELWNPIYDGRQPSVIVACAVESDVIAAAVYAYKAGLKLRVKSGGHHTFGESVCPTGTCVVADVSGLNGISVDTSQNTMIVGTGAKQREVFNALSPLGLTMNLASGGSISMGGLIHGGGFGISTRLHSVVSDSVTAARVLLLVASDGRRDAGSSFSYPALVDVTPDNEYADLFWAIRGGGGGQFAVVVSFTMKVYAQPAAVTTFSYTFGPTDSDVSRVNDAFQDWLSHAPNEFQPFVGWGESFTGAGQMRVHGFYHGNESSFISHFNVFLSAAGEAAAGSFSEAPFGSTYLNWIAYPGNDPDRRGYMSLLTVAVTRIDSTGLQRLFHAAKMYSPASFGCSGRVGALIASTGQVPHGQVGGGGFPSAYNLRQQTMSIIVSTEADGSSANTLNYIKALAHAKAVYETIRNLGDMMYCNSPLQKADLPLWAPTYFGANWQRLKSIKAKYDPSNLLDQPENLATYVDPTAQDGAWGTYKIAFAATICTMVPLLAVALIAVVFQRKRPVPSGEFSGKQLITVS